MYMITVNKNLYRSLQLPGDLTIQNLSSREVPEVKESTIELDLRSVGPVHDRALSTVQKLNNDNSKKGCKQQAEKCKRRKDQSPLVTFHS